MCDRDVRRGVRAIFVLPILVLGLWVGRAAAQPAELPEPSHRNAVVQLFNWKFAQIEAVLPDLKKLGYSHVHVSPPQKSHDGDQWYYRYQPVDFTKIEGPLGDMAAFKQMNQVADRLDMKIVVDVVFNHMADDAAYADLHFPRFGPQDFHPRAGIDYNNIQSIRTGWLGLPDLLTESDYVRGQAKEYLQMLLGCGVDGFRFDAAKHIEPEFFKAVLDVVPNDMLCFGEYIKESPNEMWPYASATNGKLDFYDFPLLRTMQSAFGPHAGDSGDLGALRDAIAAGRALPGPNAVTFVRNHDIDRDHATNGAQGISGWWMSNDDSALAYAFILGREDGVPYVYTDMPDDPQQDDKYDQPVLAAGLRFHNLCLSDAATPRRPDRWIVQEPDVIAVCRGDDALYAINKSEADSARPNLDAHLQDGRYIDLLTRQSVDVTGGKLPANWTIPKRSAVFLFKQ